MNFSTPHHTTTTPPNPLFTCTNITVKYKNSVVLTIPHFDLYPGEAVALLGPSGSGKSTFAAIIGNFLAPHATLSGTYSSSTEQGTAPRVGVVSQDAFGALNPLYYVDRQIFRTTRSMKKAHELLRSVNIPDDFHGRFPLQLSGGQRQRASIAFALGGDPDILIADEVTSALDPAATVRVVEVLRTLLKKNPHRAIVFISHDSAAARALCGRAVILQRSDQGTGFIATVAEAGTW